MRKSPYFLLIILIFFIGLNESNAQSHLEKGNYYFNKRYEKINGDKADKENINLAIKHYRKAKNETDKTIGLLKSLEFKASWADVKDSRRKNIYEKAINIAKKKEGEIPENAAIYYWHAANLARWGDMIDITDAAQEGVLDEIKSLTEKSIKLDPHVNQAGALRLLGGIHLEAPSIPFILEWPSTEEAKKLLTKAYELAPENAANTFLYAKMLIEIDQEELGRKILDDLLNRSPRKAYYLVDKKYINKGKSLHEEYFE